MPTSLIANTRTRPNVAFVRPEVAKLLPQYRLIGDCISGAETVKGKGELYLPNPETLAKTSERCKLELSKERYRKYKQRATYVNFSRRTLIGMLGLIFAVDPVETLPPLLQAVSENATGEGVTLAQLAKKATAYTVAYSRTGLFVDYPVTEEGATIAQIESGEVKPTLWAYHPGEIINWRTIQRGANDVLSLVVLFELYTFQDDGFELKKAGQFRILRLNEAGIYEQNIYREPRPTEHSTTSKLPEKGRTFELDTDLTLIPKDGKGQPLTEIPFYFIGSENNDINPDNPNFFDIADLNIAHYRNSADYEQSCFVHGQATPVVTGLNEDWYNKVLNKSLEFGSYGGIPLPVGAAAELLQAEPNGMIKEALEMKERQLVALGAKLIEQKKVQRTAFEAKAETTSESSVLTSCAHNVSSAFTQALKMAARFVNADESQIKFELNDDLGIANLSPEECRIAVELWTKDAIAFEEMRDTLRKSGYATLPTDEAKDIIATEVADSLKLEVDVMGGANGNNQ